METILQRIEKIAINEGIKITTFEKIIGASKGVLSRAINNGTDIQSKWLQSIVENYPQYSEAWLLTGNGPMLKAPLSQPETPPVTLIPANDDFVRIPVVDISVAAGAGFNNPDYIEEIECISMPSSMVRDGKQYLCVRVKGHSMVPSILDGGYLIIRYLDRSEWEYIEDNHVYVVSDREGRAYVKRLKNRLRQHGFIVCMSDNIERQHYPIFNLYEEELNSVWCAEWYFSSQIPNLQETFYQKQIELEDRIDVIESQIKKLTKSLPSGN